MLSAKHLHEIPCVTERGTSIALYANSLTVSDVTYAVENGAQGIGMLWSEYLLAQSGSESEEEQYQLYRSCLEAAQGRTVTISTCRMGTAEAAAGEYQALSLCGIRYSLQNPEKFEVQLAALLRAGTVGNLRILLPMVTMREEMERALEMVRRTKAMLRKRGVRFAENVPIGVLIETPAAALLAQELAQYASFFCIGVANLAQYTHALDRNDPKQQGYFPSISPAVHRLVRMTLDAAGQAHIPVCVCFESAAAPQLVETYVRLGARELSMDMSSLMAAKEHLIELEL
jgi:phosphoenolpyruvate-protein kinase (PTS system EI component)